MNDGWPAAARRGGGEIRGTGRGDRGARTRGVRARAAGERRLRVHRATWRRVPDAPCRGGRMNESELEEAHGEPIYECPECGSLTIRGKWAMDGARTLTDAAQKLRDYAHELEHMRSSGLELSAPVEDDYGVVRPGGAPPDGVLDADEDGV